MFKIFGLKNGIRVVTEQIDYVQSVSIGVWIGAGSAMENYENNGVSHYIEHMLFKGTTRRSAKQIAEDMDKVGGHLNAVTSKEYTCYYTKTLTEHTNLAIDVLSDMIINSTFTDENIKTERGVIGEEISMCDDNPEDVVHDTLSRIVWKNDALGFPIAGTMESLARIDRKTMLDYKGNFYCGENIVISVVGNFDEDEVMYMLEKSFSQIPSKVKKPYIQSPLKVCRGIEVVRKDIEQCHLCLGLQGFPRQTEKLYDLLVANAVFGGNMSSRLFQKVREEMGLAYSIYSYSNTYVKNGSMVIYAGLNPEKLLETTNIINEEICKLKNYGLSIEEIAVAKEQMKASMVMGLESVSSRMSNYGKSLLFDNKVQSVEDLAMEIDRVDEKSVAETLNEVLDRNCLNIALCGKITASEERIQNSFDF